MLDMVSNCSVIPAISLMVTVFANSPEDQCSISGQIIPKTQNKKRYLMPPCLKKVL